MAPPSPVDRWCDPDPLPPGGLLPLSPPSIRPPPHPCHLRHEGRRKWRIWDTHMSEDTSNGGFLLPGLPMLCLVGEGCLTPEVSLAALRNIQFG